VQVALGGLQLGVARELADCFEVRPRTSADRKVVFALRTPRAAGSVPRIACVSTSLAEEAHSDAEGNVTLRMTSATPGPGYVTTNFRF